MRIDHAQLRALAAVIREGSFDRAAMERSVNEILRRHEAWRTAFVEEGGELVQCVRPHRDIALPYDDVSHLPEAERDAAALKIGSDDARRAIDLSDAPLFRARIVKLADDNHRLYFTLHHIIFDGVSIYRVIVPERLDAHKLIEEFMILANVAAAETLEAKKTPLLYRAHDEPTLEKMRGLGEVLERVKQFQADHGDAWKPAALLEQSAQAGAWTK